jgi:hypothetical protein
MGTLQHSGARVQVYISNTMGREFTINGGSLVDMMGWKVFQYNGTTNLFGPYATFAPTFTGLARGYIVSVMDGRPVPGAKCHLRAPTGSKQSFSRSTIASEEGEFVFSSVPIGEWEIQVEAQGFIGEAQLVSTWSASEQGCIMVGLSPKLEPEQVRIVLMYLPSAPKLRGCLKFRKCAVGDTTNHCEVDLSNVAAGLVVRAKENFDAKHVSKCGLGINTMTMDDEVLNNVDYKVTSAGMALCGKETHTSHVLKSIKTRQDLLRSGAQVKVYVSNTDGQAFQVDAPHQVIDGDGWKIFQYNGSTEVFGPYSTAAPTFGGTVTGSIVDALTGRSIPGASIGLKPVSAHGLNAAQLRLRLKSLNPLQKTRWETHSGIDGSFSFSPVPIGTSNLIVGAEGYISVEQSVQTWSVSVHGCIMVALSPVLAEHEVRLVLTYQPTAPKLSSCLKFQDSSKRCDVCPAHSSCALSTSGSSAAPTKGLLNFEKQHVGKCRMGLSTVTMENAVLDWVNYKVVVPGMSSECGNEAAGAAHPEEARKYLLQSGATLNVYTSNSRGQQFRVGKEVRIDQHGWKVLQYNGTTDHLGPYRTRAPTTGAPTSTVSPTMSPTLYGGVGDGWVYNAINGKPIAGANVTIKAPFEASSSRRLLGASLNPSQTTRKDGHFHMRNVQVGTFEAEVSAPGFITITKMVSTWNPSTDKGCMWFVLSPVLEKDQYRAVLTWSNTTKPLSSLSTVVDCSATAYSPTCTTTSTINGVDYTSNSLHNIEIPSVGECKFGLSTVTVTGEHENVIKYLVVMPGYTTEDLISKQGGKPYLSPQQILEAKMQYLTTGADATFYKSNAYADDLHFPAIGNSWIDGEGWHVFNYDTQSGQILDWSKNQQAPVKR